MTGKTCLITGAGSGIGAASARLMASQGYRVALTDIDLTAVKTIATEIQNEGGQAIALQLNIASEEQWIAALKQVDASFGGLDILINNAAGFGSGEMLVDTALEEWRRIIAISVDGTFLGIKHAIPMMEKRGGGSIVNVSSVLGKVAMIGASAYVASKGAVTMLTKAAALECAHAGNGVRINSVHPGFVSTPALHERLEGEALDMVVGMHPMGRLASSEEIAEAIAFLASDASSFCTGSELVADGGYTAR